MAFHLSGFDFSSRLKATEGPDEIEVLAAFYFLAKVFEFMACFCYLIEI